MRFKSAAQANIPPQAPIRACFRVNEQKLPVRSQPGQITFIPLFALDPEIDSAQTMGDFEIITVELQSGAAVRVDAWPGSDAAQPIKRATAAL